MLLCMQHTCLAVCCLYAEESDGENEEYATASTERGKILIVPFDA